MTNHRVLVVEDDIDIRDSLSDLLEQEGFEVATAANGREGLDAVAQARPCLVLLDLMMPVMDGWQVLDHLRSKPETADLPVVVVTAQPAPAPKANALIKKPFSIESVLEQVTRFCGPECTGESGGGRAPAA